MPVRNGRHALVFLEHIGEMGGVAESKGVGNLRDGTAQIEQVVARMLDAPPLIVRHRTPAGGPAENRA